MALAAGKRRISRMGWVLIVLAVLAVIGYSVIGYRTVRWLRFKPRDWRYAALIITESASWEVA